MTIPKRSLSKNRNVILDLFKQIPNTFSIAWMLAARDIKSKYTGSLLAYFWIVLTPLVYAVVFVFVREHFSKSGLVSDSGHVPSIMVAFSGVLLWQVWLETLLKQIDFIRSGKSFLYSLRVPVEVFFFSRLISSVMDFLVRGIIIILFAMFTGSSLGLSSVMSLAAFFCLVATSNCLGLYLALPGSFFPDVTRTIQSLSLGIFLASPVFYSIDFHTNSILIVLNMFHPFGAWLQTFRDAAFGGDFVMLWPSIIWGIVLIVPAPFALAYYKVIVPRIIERI